MSSDSACFTALTCYPAGRSAPSATYQMIGNQLTGDISRFRLTRVRRNCERLDIRRARPHFERPQTYAQGVDSQTPNSFP